jgi:hypothetical protein
VTNNESVLEANLQYAVRMVRAGFVTPEQAAQTCGVSVAELYARLNRVATEAPDRSRR